MDRIVINTEQSLGTINRNIYGHFSEHIGGVFYDGLWVGEGSGIENIRGFRAALVESFKKINPPVLRWPGGCFAETYDWRDGIGPREKRPTRVNWWYSSDKRLESNQVGTHEFIDFCNMVGAQPYFAANMTSVTPLHIRNWIEYCNFPQDTTTLANERAQNGSPQPFNVKYWGIGNENWGGGGQMTPEMCAREYIKFSTVCNSLDKGNLKFVLCGANGHDIAWTRRLLKEISDRSWEEAPTYGMSVHYYTNQGYNADPINYTQDDWYALLIRANYMQRVLDDHRSAMDEFDPERKIALIVDEWGNWHRGGSGPSKGYNLFEQQSTMRDAVVAAMTLNMFNNRCDSVKMANVAQLCNNLHSLYLAGGDNFVETPNYHVFDMFKAHQDARHVRTDITTSLYEKEGCAPLELLSASASVAGDILTLTVANLDYTASRELRLDIIGSNLSKTGNITLLSHADPRTCNTFENPFAVVPSKMNIDLSSGKINIPAASVISLSVNLEDEKAAK